ncbi:MAG: nitrate transporter [Xanthobacteraceae bacterium]|jgi:NitT/TauT family transport system ATP-binding protein|nr:nitrate transporter [Xanthobacteraceae bacterium]
MSATDHRLRIGYIPLVDATALIVAVDKNFTADEGLDVDLVREVSWSNVRDKLNIGLFHAAHLLAPVAIASSLGIGHVRVPIAAPFVLGVNGNAITLTAGLHRLLSDACEGDLSDPMESAKALARVVQKRKQQGRDPLTFGMTFPFSNHNYQLRFWMAAGGVDPDEDVRLVVLPPPYMVESLASGHVDGFCVGAPWNSVAVDLGIGRILHFGCDLVARLSEKVLAVRQSYALDQPDIVSRLVRALARAADFSAVEDNHDEVAAILSAPHRIGVARDIIRGALDGRLRTARGGPVRTDKRYMLIGGGGVPRPDPVHAAWIYAQMVRWGQTPLSDDAMRDARAVYRPDLYDAALGLSDDDIPTDSIEAFAGPAFDAQNIAAYLPAWNIGRQG